MKIGWQIKPIGEVCEVVNGGTPKTEVKDYWGENHLWITPAEMGKRLSPYVEKTERSISDQGLRNSSARMLPPYSVILSSRAPIGHLVINTKPMSTNQGCKGLIPGKHLQYKYLYYFLLFNVDLLNSLGTGATFKELSGSKLKEVSIPFPLLEEQQRIVALLDEAFEGIAKAKANAEKNLQNTSALFSILLTNQILQMGNRFPRISIGIISEIESGGTPSTSKKEYWGGEIPWYSSGELNSTYTTNPAKKITYEGLINSNAKIFPKGSLLVGMYDTAALKMSILDREGAFNQAIAGIRPNNNINLEYILNAINANKPRLLQERRGTRQNNLSLSKIKEIEIPLPEIEMQNEIVNQVKFIKNETLRLKAIYQEKINLLETLKKSILHQAFSGEL